MFMLFVHYSFFVFCVHYLMLFCFCVEEIICVLCASYNIIFVCALCLRHDICFVCSADPGSSHAQAISAVGLLHRPISDKICKRNVVIISSFFSLWSVISFAQSFIFWYDPNEVESFFCIKFKLGFRTGYCPFSHFYRFWALFALRFERSTVWGGGI